MATNLIKECISVKEVKIRSRLDSINRADILPKNGMLFLITIVQKSRLKVSIKMNPLHHWRAYTKTTEN